jgi:phage major head subunit gpT-like protein
MIINNASQLQALFTSFIARFQDLYSSLPAPYIDKLANTTTTTTEVVRFPWMGQLPVVREWIGDRKENSAALKFYDVVPKLFETTFGLDKSKIDDDQYGFFSANILPQMAQEARKWPDYRLVDEIQANRLWADGKAFFATDHPIHVDKPEVVGFDGNNYFSNEYTSTPLNLENYAMVRQEMMARTGENGKSLGIMPNLLVYEASNEQTALHILKSSMIAPGTFGNQTSQVGAINNPYVGTAEGLLIPELAYDTVNATATLGRWMLLDTTKAIKPFGWLQREAFSFAMRTSPTDPVVFDKNKYLFGGRGRGEAHNSFPILASRCTP